jgi:DNA polymerase-3 subunit gamma/tau
MFYLKYRPQTIADLDNKNIAEKISTILNNGTDSIPHAFLFTGQKGTGKTSTARIIAKAINCENNIFAKKGTDFEPCNKCSNCLSITSGNNVDVIEIDAASNRKIDEIRDLISKIKYAPINSRYKIYIIDEVHMLTNESFNALLKTLEEPPKNTIFILATTELEKLPKTVISRCINFNFGKANQNEILAMFNRILKNEKVIIQNDVLEFIAQHADNSFRDATKILEEVLIDSKNKEEITIEDVKKILGILNEKNNLLKIMENNSSENLKNAFEFIENYESKAGNFKALIENILNTLHQLLLKKAGMEISLDEEYNFSLKQISILIKLFTEAFNGLKYSANEALVLEVAIAEYFERQV